MTTEQSAPEAGAETVTVSKADIQFCIDAIAKMHEHKARLRLETMVAASPSPPPVGVGGWRDMSTAPKDGTWFLGRQPDTSKPANVIRWDAEGNHWSTWRVSADGGRDPDAWMPLPSPSCSAPPVGGEVVKLLEALKACEAHVKRNYNANGGWWNDPTVYALVTEVIEPARSALVPSSPSLLGPRFKIRQLGEIKCEGIYGEPEHINGLVLEALSDDDVRAAGSLFGQTVTVGVSS